MSTPGPSVAPATGKVIPIHAAPEAGGHPRAEVISMYRREATIYPREVGGRFATWRWVFVFLTQALFYGLPWWRWNGRQAVLFDLGSRRFYLFDLVLYPQDFIYLAVLLIICAYGLFLFTAVAGRVWCGFACPQTVYSELFLWIERRWEGSRVRRMKLDRSAWTLDKTWRKGGKHATWLLLSLWTGFTFVGYFTPMDVLSHEVITASLGPWELFWTGFYGLATYGNAGFLREQVCKYMCPYARFQSAMFDRDTLIVTYDQARGEPRGSRGRQVDARSKGQGDCIDCTLCVQVCPTGIDIRQGLQYECIGCAACVDVCDSVMDKVGSPRGLIRHATHHALENGWGRRQMLARVMRPRVLIYSAVLLCIVLAFGASLFGRAPFSVNVLRDQGVLARLVEDGHIENVYRVQIMNATERDQRYRLRADHLPGSRLVAQDEITVGPAQTRWVPVSVRIGPELASSFGAGARPFDIVVVRQRQADWADREVKERTTFMVPR
ncbi:MAG: cytochrome c oxidase accessory protein CcoG [Rubrivivax sp.]|nr:MAG: cytochrome c oxidase accessory protein CcoG [Rubrivivax sp.]